MVGTSNLISEFTLRNTPHLYIYNKCSRQNGANPGTFARPRTKSSQPIPLRREK